MHEEHPAANRRILIVDDNASIHDDFRKIIGPARRTGHALMQAEIVLFGDEPNDEATVSFQLDHALQGEQGVSKVRQAQAERRPYAVAFIDVRMPPGMDGVMTAHQIWEHDPDIQVVICTAYSDYSWEQIRRKLGRSDRFVILKKPFDNMEVKQLATMLTEKWQRSRQTRNRLAVLDQMINERMRTEQRGASRLVAVGGVQVAQERRTAQLNRDLEQAVCNGALTVHYQPLVEIASRRAVSLEALVRWQHPSEGWISPGEFIPLAEASGLIVPLGELVLRQVCEQVARWRQERVPVVPVAVNVSAVQLQAPEFFKRLRQMLQVTGMQPQHLALELTESTLVKDMQHHVGELQALRSEGVRIEIDDFGTGYSSLSYLRHLPVDTLKIDRSFIHRIDSNAADATIVGAILNMAHTLGMNVIAEGVETAAQLEVLRCNGCEIAQGFFFSRPLPAEQCRQLLLDLGKRPAFTETLRIQLVRKEAEAPQMPANTRRRPRL